MPAPSIYLDHNSTTPIDPRVVESMVRAWRDCGANPASQHALGRKARRTLEDAREGIAELLGAKTGGMDADQVIFTSGGTEANNLAIFGLAGKSGDRVVISAFEHPSVRNSVQELRRHGWNIIELYVHFGKPVWIDPHYLSASVSDKRFRTTLISIMLANNEAGVIVPVRGLIGGSGDKNDQTLYAHTDAVQAVGKIPVHFRDLGVDAMTVAPHKFHGPLGIGALVLKHGVQLQPRMFGGFQQAGLRPGTENVALAVGFHEALKIATAELPERAERMRTLRDGLERELIDFGRRDACPTVVVGADAPRLPNTSCIAFPGLDRQALVMALDLAGVACSTGSACASGSSEPSPTLVAMGLPKAVIDSAIRLSLSAFTTREEIAESARRIIKTVKHLRSQK